MKNILTLLFIVCYMLIVSSCNDKNLFYKTDSFICIDELDVDEDTLLHELFNRYDNFNYVKYRDDIFVFDRFERDSSLTYSHISLKKNVLSSQKISNKQIKKILHSERCMQKSIIIFLLEGQFLALSSGQTFVHDNIWCRIQNYEIEIYNMSKKLKIEKKFEYGVVIYDAKFIPNTNQLLVLTIEKMTKMDHYLGNQPNQIFLHKINLNNEDCLTTEMTDFMMLIDNSVKIIYKRQSEGLQKVSVVCDNDIIAEDARFVMFY